MIKKFKKYIKTMHLNVQMYEVNEMIDLIHHSNIDDLKKVKIIIELKQIRYNVHILQQKRKHFNANKKNKQSHLNLVQQEIMRKINPLCDKKDTFKYSILISLHYYDINCHPERITKLKPYEDKYDFTNTTYTTFEQNNPSISLTVYDENNNAVHKSINSTDKKATIVKSKDNTPASIKPLTPNQTKFDNFLKKYTHKEITEYIMSKHIITLFLHLLTVYKGLLATRNEFTFYIDIFYLNFLVS